MSDKAAVKKGHQEEYIKDAGKSAPVRNRTFIDSLNRLGNTKRVGVA